MAYVSLVRTWPRDSVSVTGTEVKFADALKLLDVTLDRTLSFDKHVSDIVQACNFHIRALRHI